MKFFLGIIFGLVISAIGVYALSINSKDVSYNNSNVENALDDLYERIGTSNTAQSALLGKVVDWDGNTGTYRDITDGFVWDRRTITGREYGTLAFPHRKMRVSSNDQYGQYTVISADGSIRYPGNIPTIVDKGDIVVGPPASSIILTFTYVDD